MLCMVILSILLLHLMLFCFSYEVKQASLILFKRWIALFNGSFTLQWIIVEETNCKVTHWLEIYLDNSVMDH